MRQKPMWLRIVSIVGLVVAITALSVEPAPAHGFGAVTSEGVQVHQASQWHNAGITGQGVKVGVIDTGFEGIEALLGTELPATVQALCYTEIGRATENLSDCETRSNHGTQVAESLMDMAPGVVLYIAKPSPGSLGDLRASTDWMISEGVQVINHSVGWPLDGPGDGTSPFGSSPLKTVDHAVENGVLWVNAASNDAENTWFINRPFSNPDGDRFVNFSGVDEAMSFHAKAGDSLRVEMRWDDTWGGASKDLDLLLVDRFNRLIGGSFERQGGGNRDYPLERFSGFFNVSGIYGVAIGHRDGAVPDWTQMLVHGSTRLEYHTLTGSTFNPEESAKSGMLAVGAAPWHNPTAIARYSGRGPTTDGREKPEVVGADCAVTTFRQNFCGTSQASPHVAGMAALVLQKFPSYSPTDVADYLKLHAVQRSSPDPNYDWGHGFAVMPPPLPPPSPTINTPVQPGPDWLSVSWTPNTQLGIEPSTSHDLRYIPAAEDSSVDSNWILVPDVGMPASHAYRITGLSGGSSYRIAVRGHNVWGPGQWSPAVNVTTSPPVVPEAPTGLTATQVPGEAKVELTWDAPASYGGSPITGYLVELSLDDGTSWSEVYTSNDAATTYTDAGTDDQGPTFDAGNWPQYRVAAINGVGTGPFSESVPSGDELLTKYDTNRNGVIDIPDILAAISAYKGGDTTITISDILKLINRYRFG